ncbi:MAG TPA: biopolymer transporter ExbD [Opitutaceae bacterium]|nr:biopolymer transporter ExbD [Opitutaceae bacterium]
MAGPSGKAEPGKKKARIEIIPLIDVIFFLLATFVLFTLSLDRISSVPVTLPKAQVSSGPPDTTTINIQVSDAGTYYWKVGSNGAPELITASEILPRLENVRSREAEPRVLVRGDNRAKFGAAVMVLDQVRKAGIDQVSVETVTSPTGK